MIFCVWDWGCSSDLLYYWLTKPQKTCSQFRFPCRSHCKSTSPGFSPSHSISILSKQASCRIVSSLQVWNSCPGNSQKEMHFLTWFWAVNETLFRTLHSRSCYLTRIAMLTVFEETSENSSLLSSLQREITQIRKPANKKEKAAKQLKSYQVA